MGLRVNQGSVDQFGTVEKQETRQPTREEEMQARRSRDAQTGRQASQAVGIVGKVAGGVVSAYDPSAGEMISEGSGYVATAGTQAANIYESNGDYATIASSTGTMTLEAYNSTQEPSAFSAEGQANAWREGAEKQGANAAKLESRAQRLKEKNPKIVGSDGTIDTSTKQGKQAYRAAYRADELRAKQADWNNKANKLSPPKK